ncbi:MAG: SDR family oxidoreductase [Anaerolineae bacterium]
MDHGCGFGYRARDCQTVCRRGRSGRRCGSLRRRLGSLVKEVEAMGCLPPTIVTGDVSNRADAEKMVETVNAYGSLDVVVNNAGIMDEFTPLGDLDDALWQQVMGVNIDGPMYICRKALRSMLPKGKGAIVNVSSVSGLFGGRAGVSYTTSKHALIGLTRSIAYHYAKEGDSLSAVCPGGVATNISIRNPDPLGYERLQTTFGMAVRQAEAVELARTILFLASDDSSFVNGEVLVADGGWTAG